MFTAKNGHWRARFLLLQDDHDGAVAVLGSFHEKSLCPTGLEILLIHGAFLGGITSRLAIGHLLDLCHKKD